MTQEHEFPGLIKAARRLDEKRGFEHVSYAVWSIRQATPQAPAGFGPLRYF